MDLDQGKYKKVACSEDEPCLEERGRFIIVMHMFVERNAKTCMSLAGEMCCWGYCVPEAYQINEEDCCCPEHIDCSSVDIDSNACKRDEDCPGKHMHCCWDPDCAADHGICIFVEEMEECTTSKCS